jgi:hypothetical protein
VNTFSETVGAASQRAADFEAGLGEMAAEMTGYEAVGAGDENGLHAWLAPCSAVFPRSAEHHRGFPG